MTTQQNFYSTASATAKQEQAKRAKGNSNKPKRKYPLPNEGGHLARIVQVVFLGLQKGKVFKGVQGDDKQQMRITFELTNTLFDRVVDEESGKTEKQPYWLSVDVNVSNSDRSNSIKWATQLGLPVNLYNEFSFKTKTGEQITVKQYDADWSEAIGKQCQVFVQHNKWEDKQTGEDRESAKIKDVMAAMQGFDAPPLHDEDKTVLFSPLDPRPESVATFNEFPNWLQEKITGALDWNTSPLKEALEGGSVKQEAPKQESKPESKEPEPDLMNADDVPFDADDPFDV